MIEVEFNDAEVTLALARALEALGDLREFMGDAGEILPSSTQDRIQRGVQPDGEPFAPRSPATVRRYERLGLGFGAPLNQTGQMRLGIHYEAGLDYFELGSNAVQAAVMQFGARQGEFGAHIGKDKLGRDHFHHIPWGDIPARPFLGLSDQDRSDVMAELAEWLEESLRGGA